MPSSAPPDRPVEPAGAPVAMRKKRTTQDMLAENKGPGLAITALRTLAGLLIVAAILLALFLIAVVIEGDDPGPRAPWNSSSAPIVRPAPLADQ